MMERLMKMWDDELKELAKLIAERQRPTKKMEEVSHEEVQEGQAQEVKGEEEQEEDCH